MRVVMNGFVSNGAIHPEPTAKGQQILQRSRQAPQKDVSLRSRQAPQIYYLRDIAALLGYQYSYVRQVASDVSRIYQRLPQSVHDNLPPLHRFGRRWGIYAPHFNRWLQGRIRQAERAGA